MTLAPNEDRLSSRGQDVNSRYGIDAMERGAPDFKTSGAKPGDPN